MGRRKLVAAAVTLALVTWTAQASAGWVIEEAVKSTGDDRQQTFVQSNRMKTVLLDADGKPGIAFIVDLDAETITQVDYEQRTYVTGTVQEYVETMQTAVQAVGPMLSEAMKEMEAALKEMPAEQRRMMEQMLRQQMGQQPGAGPQECREPSVELRATGETASIAGFRAVRHELLTDGELELEVWLARDIAVVRELDARKLQRFAAEMGKLAACSPGRGEPGPGHGAWQAMTEGYPVRTVDRASGTTVEVVKAERRTIPAVEFQPPAGFARRTLEELIGQ
jgi:hypothetical protein